MDGYWKSLERENIRAMVNRKNGETPALARLTRGGAELHHMLIHQLGSLPEVQLDPVQNDDGTFPYMPGWDGPIGG